MRVFRCEFLRDHLQWMSTTTTNYCSIPLRQYCLSSPFYRNILQWCFNRKSLFTFDFADTIEHLRVTHATISWNVFQWIRSAIFGCTFLGVVGEKSAVCGCVDSDILFIYYSLGDNSESIFKPPNPFHSYVFSSAFSMHIVNSIE